MNEEDFMQIDWSIDRNQDYSHLATLELLANIEQDFYDATQTLINGTIQFADDEFIPFEQEIETNDILVKVEPFATVEHDCCICMETKQNDHFCKLNCSHQFCGECISTMMNSNNIAFPCCPLCRTSITQILVQTKNMREYFENNN